MIRGAIEAATFVKTPRAACLRDLWRMASYAVSRRDSDESHSSTLSYADRAKSLSSSSPSLSRTKNLSISLPGISWKKDGRLIENFERRVQPMDTFAPPAFDLTDFDAYERATGKRELAYATSVGCPYACNYCTDMVVYKRRFNAYTADHVVAELTGSRSALSHSNMWPSSTPTFPSICSEPSRLPAASATQV